MKNPDIESIIKNIRLLGSSQSIADVGALANIQVMGNEVLIDLSINSPSLQSKKKIEVLGGPLKGKN
ncbi:MAG: hypothetical protein CM15mP83_5090 [Flavobacteriaceae bacterium]|nr:MAG: hypothetical protein CM15mP83_5090 [Flavobacteriaceae bacterium]